MAKFATPNLHFIWICTERSKMLPFGGKHDKKKISKLEKKIRKAVNSKISGCIEVAESARKRWVEIYAELAEEKDGLYGALTARAEPQIMRMACIYALLDESNMVLTEHLEAAYAVWNYADASVKYIFGDSLGDPTADAILAALIEKADDGLTLSGIHGLFQRSRSADRIHDALQKLEAKGLIEAFDNATGGRPAQTWFAK